VHPVQCGNVGVRVGHRAALLHRDRCEAVEPGPLFAMHRAAPDQGCVVGYGIQPAMQGIYEGIEETLRRELARVTLEDVLRDVLAAPR
jgi:hypothetical protein